MLMQGISLFTSKLSICEIHGNIVLEWIRSVAYRSAEELVASNDCGKQSGTERKRQTNRDRDIEK